MQEKLSLFVQRHVCLFSCVVICVYTSILYGLHMNTRYYSVSFLYVCVCRPSDLLLLQESCNELICLGMYLKQVTAVWIINNRLYTHGHVIYVAVAVTVTVVTVVQAVSASC